MGQIMHVGTRPEQQEEGWAERRGSGPRLVGPPPSQGSAAELPRAQRQGTTAALSVTKDDPRIDRIARSRISVLIVGETGSGKEVLAQRLHERSDRANKPLVSVNCAAVCGSLIESELFGHTRGAFTSADQAKAGLFEAADGGTLFLDEVGDLSMAAQTKLLRVLETREVQRVGSVTSRTVDVRFIAATNVDLEAATASGRFREDLLFRLDVMRLHVPPLRARIDEIVPAAMQFLATFSASGHKENPPILTAAAEVALQRHTWIGNFRELRNVIERAALICANGEIQPEDLMLPGGPSAPVSASSHTPAPAASNLSLPLPISLPMPLAVPPTLAKVRLSPATEHERIIKALDQCAGNQTRAARLLGVSRRTLITRLETFGVARPRARPLRVISGTTASV